ncbi:hypothetical protein NLJ89_g11855 [Agrocybe chaxingu]|uniref:Uncharacterized protein n=1 Tax=Agrocybe chaxingu TaxID=84603 RepID=A0A9W8JPA0_9AGAR|nr:hypothetical protein NLJ89_g11855 [Agrocybe chaxingu]
MGSSNSIQAVPYEAGTLAVGTPPQTTAEDVQANTFSPQNGSETKTTAPSDEEQSEELKGAPVQTSEKHKVYFPRWDHTVRGAVAFDTSTTTTSQRADIGPGCRLADPGKGDTEATGAPQSQSSTGSRNITKTEGKEGNEIMTTSHSGGGGIEGGSFGLERTRNVNHEDHEGEEADSNGSDDSGEESDDPDFPVWTGPRPCCHSHCVPRPRPK